MDSCNPSSKRADSQHGRMRWEKRDRNFQFCGRSAWSGEKFDSFTTLWKSEVWPAETSSLAWCNGSSIWFWSFGTCFELNLNRVLKLRFASLKIVEKKKKIEFFHFWLESFSRLCFIYFIILIINVIWVRWARIRERIDSANKME